MSSKPLSEIIPVTIEEELKRSYLDYAMSVIVSRALPDVRDGLKPVHRRILYTMIEEGFDHDKPYRKSARIVGQVISKYHPHGTEPIYGSIVRMAQTFSLRLPLVDGHGNFGSMDGDKAADMRYTEARLSHAAHYVLMDYDKETVEYQPNYDDTLYMPTVLPARFPNILVNGASGIAVGMATNIPSHHLGEVIEGCCLLIDNPDATLDDLLEHIKGPDFPTGGIIIGLQGIREAYRTGRGSFILRGRHHIETLRKDREAIIITEIPYQVNKATLIERIAELVNQKDIDGISDLRDESDRHGVRIVIELKREAIAEVILNRLHAMTPLQTSFGINMLALHQGRPVQMTLKEILEAFLEFRRTVVMRRTQFYLRRDRYKAHTLAGLAVAVSHIDEVIALIKAARDSNEALQALLGRQWPIDSILLQYLERLEDTPMANDYRLSEEQAKAILALRLHRLTGMERNKLFQDLESLCRNIEGYLELLQSSEKLWALIKAELIEVKELFTTPRLTEIQAAMLSPQEAEDLIPCEDMVVTVSMKGYIKRVPLSTYRSQRRGGRGKHAMLTREEDEVEKVFVADTHTLLVCFTSLGKAYQLKVHELPTSSRGKPLISLFPLSSQENLATLLPLPKDPADHPPYIVFATSHGYVRKNALSDFLSIRANGKLAMRLSEGEHLIAVALANDNQDILLSSRYGKSIRFAVSDLRQFSSRQSVGVRGMLLKGKDEIVAMSILRSSPYSAEEAEKYLRYMAQQRRQEDEGEEPLNDLDKDLMAQMEQEEQFILSISDKGFGKRTSCYAYRRALRGGQGVATMDVTERTGSIVNALPAKNEDHILLLTDLGQLLRCPVEGIRISGRRTQGVKLFRLQGDEKIVSIAVLNPEVALPAEEAESPDSSE